MALTVMSWNIWDFNRQETDPSRERAVLAHLSKVAPDILLLQEFCDDGTDEHAAGRLHDVQDELDMVGRLALSRDTRFHTVVLWRRDITEVGPWIAYDRSFWHSAGITTLEVAPGRLLRVGSVHLSPRDADSRVADTRSLTWLGGSDLATLLAGDWNNIGEDPGYDTEPAIAPAGGDHRSDRRCPALLTEGGLIDVASRLGATWQPTYGHLRPERGPGARIDAFRASATALSWIGGYAVDTAAGDASDHRPITLTLDPR